LDIDGSETREALTDGDRSLLRQAMASSDLLSNDLSHPRTTHRQLRFGGQSIYSRVALPATLAVIAAGFAIIFVWSVTGRGTTAFVEVTDAPPVDVSVERTTDEGASLTASAVPPSGQPTAIDEEWPAGEVLVRFGPEATWVVIDRQSRYWVSDETYLCLKDAGTVEMTMDWIELDALPDDNRPTDPCTPSPTATTELLPDRVGEGIRLRSPLGVDLDSSAIDWGIDGSSGNDSVDLRWAVYQDVWRTPGQVALVEGEPSLRDCMDPTVERWLGSVPSEIVAADTSICMETSEDGWAWLEIVEFDGAEETATLNIHYWRDRDS
jgi:hypothetical protein